jgi:hypothetical protein
MNNHLDRRNVRIYQKAVAELAHSALKGGNLLILKNIFDLEKKVANTTNNNNEHEKKIAEKFKRSKMTIILLASPDRRLKSQLKGNIQLESEGNPILCRQRVLREICSRIPEYEKEILKNNNNNSPLEDILKYFLPPIAASPLRVSPSSCNYINCRFEFLQEVFIRSIRANAVNCVKFFLTCSSNKKYAEEVFGSPIFEVIDFDARKKHGLGMKRAGSAGGWGRDQPNAPTGILVAVEFGACEVLRLLLDFYLHLSETSEQEIEYFAAKKSSSSYNFDKMIFPRIDADMHVTFHRQWVPNHRGTRRRRADNVFHWIAKYEKERGLFDSSGVTNVSDDQVAVKMTKIVLDAMKRVPENSPKFEKLFSAHSTLAEFMREANLVHFPPFLCAARRKKLGLLQYFADEFGAEIIKDIPWKAGYQHPHSTRGNTFTEQMKEDLRAVVGSGKEAV